MESKVVVVTGGASGIGRAAVLRFSEEGYAPVLLDRDAEAGAATLSLLEGKQVEGRFIQADLTKTPCPRRSPTASSSSPATRATTSPAPPCTSAAAWSCREEDLRTYRLNVGLSTDVPAGCVAVKVAV